MIHQSRAGKSLRRLRQGEHAAGQGHDAGGKPSPARHRALSPPLLDAIMPYCGNTLRLGVTGTPGAGKVFSASGPC
ncbi:hypothetical protein ACNKHU_17595 [Shigella flexneri]